MALKPLHHSLTSMSFDCLDAQMSTIKGGEVLGLSYQALPGDLASADELTDGYTSYARRTRAVATNTLVSGMRPLFLADDGLAGYGTLFGSVVGGTAGAAVTPSAINVSSIVASGKVTAWSGPGLFAVTLDAVDTATANGLHPENLTLNGNAALYATTAGKLTPNSAIQFENIVVARFVEFQTIGSKVSTQASMVGTTGGFAQALIHFTVET